MLQPECSPWSSVSGDPNSVCGGYQSSGQRFVAGMASCVRWLGDRQLLSSSLTLVSPWIWAEHTVVALWCLATTPSWRSTSARHLELLLMAGMWWPVGLARCCQICPPLCAGRCALDAGVTTHLS